MWMAGGGVNSGISFGKTDDYAYAAVDGRVHVHDWHATILHLLGLDHKQLTYHYAGREMRLTDVKGNVVKDNSEAFVASRFVDDYLARLGCLDWPNVAELIVLHS